MLPMQAACACGAGIEVRAYRKFVRRPYAQILKNHVFLDKNQKICYPVFIGKESGRIRDRFVRRRRYERGAVFGRMERRNDEIGRRFPSYL